MEDAYIPQYHGEIMATDRRLIELGYEPVAVDGKRALGAGWSTRPNTPEAIAIERAALPAATNTGLRTGRLVGADIDIVDPGHAAAVKALADDMLGAGMVRVGSKGAMLCYRNEAPIRKITIAGKDAAGIARKVEILGTGQQFVAYGIHPDTGRAYDWPDAAWRGEPLNTPLVELVETTPDKLRTFAQRAAALLTEQGYSDVTVSDPGDPDRATARAQKRREDRVPVARDDLIEILGYIPPDCGRNEWIGFLGAIQATNRRGVADGAMDGELLDLAQAWSRGDYAGAQPDNFGGDDDVEATYYSLDPMKAGGSTFGSLWAAARANGYDKPPPGRATEDKFQDYLGNAAEHAPPAPEPPEPASWAEYVDRLVAEQGAAGGGAARKCEGWLTWRQLRVRPREQAEWVWHQRLLANETNIYTGMPGIGKTTLSENLAVAVSAGVPFLGHDTKAMRVALLLAEDVYGPVGDNIVGIAQHLGVGDGLLDDMLTVWSVKSDPYPGGHMLARIADDGTIAPTRFLIEKIIPELTRRRGPVLFIVDPLAEFVSANRNLDVPARVVSKGFLEQLCRLNGGKVTVLANDHPSKSSQNDQSYIAGSVQVSAAFALTATLRKPDRPAGIEGQRDLVFQTLKPKYGPETITPLYRSADCPAFIVGTGPAAILRDIKNDVYRHVIERDDKGLVTSKTNQGEYGPGEIAHALGKDEDAVKRALKTLVGTSWILWQSRNGGHGAGTYVPGPQGPKISSLEPSRAAEIDPFES